MTYSGRTRFRTSLGFLAMYAALALVALAAAIASSRSNGETWIMATCWLVFAGLVVAVFDAASSFVSLDVDQLRVRRHFRTTVILRQDIASVAAPKGCPITLILKDGRKIEIPDFGVKGVDNSLRSWVRAQEMGSSS